MGNGNYLFTTMNDSEEQSDGTIRDWAMKVKTEDDTYIFHSVKPGRHEQYYCLYEKNW